MVECSSLNLFTTAMLEANLLETNIKSNLFVRAIAYCFHRYRHLSDSQHEVFGRLVHHQNLFGWNNLNSWHITHGRRRISAFGDDAIRDATDQNQNRVTRPDPSNGRSDVSDRRHKNREFFLFSETNPWQVRDKVVTVRVCAREKKIVPGTFGTGRHNLGNSEGHSRDRSREINKKYKLTYMRILTFVAPTI
jgi:hypothetical protein